MNRFNNKERYGMLPRIRLNTLTVLLSITFITIAHAADPVVASVSNTVAGNEHVTTVEITFTFSDADGDPCHIAVFGHDAVTREHFPMATFLESDIFNQTFAPGTLCIPKTDPPLFSGGSVSELTRKGLKVTSDACCWTVNDPNKGGDGKTELENVSGFLQDGGKAARDGHGTSHMGNVRIFDLSVAVILPSLLTIQL